MVWLLSCPKDRKPRLSMIMAPVQPHTAGEQQTWNQAVGSSICILNAPVTVNKKEKMGKEMGRMEPRNVKWQQKGHKVGLWKKARAWKSEKQFPIRASLPYTAFLTRGHQQHKFPESFRGWVPVTRRLYDSLQSRVRMFPSPLLDTEASNIHLSRLQWESHQWNSKCIPRGTYLQRPCKFQSKDHAMHLPALPNLGKLTPEALFASHRSSKRFILEKHQEKGSTWVGDMRMSLMTLGK